nr:hypothetical protein [Tanacetum cinerariifolium]
MTTFLTGDVRYGEAFPTVSRLDARHDRENITKTSTMPLEALPRVTSLGGGERNMQQKLQELMDICTSLQRQHSLIEERDLLVRDIVKDSDKSADKGSDSTDEMANVLGTLGAVNILASRGLRSVFTTTSLSVATASGSFPTAAICTTASVETPTTRVTRSPRGVVIGSSSPISVNIPSISKKDKGKGKMTEPEHPSKEKVLEQMSVQLARDLEAKFYQEYQIIREQAEIDSEIARIHEKMQDFVPMNSKLESERLKRPEIQLDKERFKKLKTAKASGIEPTQEKQSEEPKELYEEELKKIIELVPVEELYIEALQVKYHIIGWEIYSEGQRKYWKIVRVRNHTEVYQIFKDMLKKVDREDLDKLWSLVKETCSTT